MERLNRVVIPSRFECESEVHAGPEVEIDVATSERDEPPVPFGANGAGGTATVAAEYAPPAPAISAVAAFADPDLFEVKVYKDEGGVKLVTVIELVSESNKDRPPRRRTFATK